METELRSWRLFCAVDLPATARDRVMQHIASLRDRVPEAAASWSRDANIHLTIKFIGETPPARAEDLSLAAGRAAAQISPFEFELAAAGAFPKHGAPKVLWIGIRDSSGKLHDLHSRLEAECAQVGFAKDQREFHPHLTVARLREPRGARTLAIAHKELGFKSLTVSVSELLVIRSQLSSQGSRYSVISRSPLGG